MVTQDPHVLPRPLPRFPAIHLFFIHAPTSPAPPVQIPPGSSPFGKKRTPVAKSVGFRGDFDHVTHDKLHDLSCGRGSARKDSKAVVETRVATMDALERKRVHEMPDGMDATDDSRLTQGGRCRVGPPHLAFFADGEVVKERAQWWDPEWKAHWDVDHASPVEGVGAGIPPRAADECSEAWDRALLEEEVKLNGAPARAAKEREIAEWKRFKVF